MDIHVRRITNNHRSSERHRGQEALDLVELQKNFAVVEFVRIHFSPEFVRIHFSLEFVRIHFSLEFVRIHFSPEFSRIQLPDRGGLSRRSPYGMSFG